MLALSVSAARRSVKSRVESGCGQVLAKWFESYGRTLELWFRDVLINLEREFNGSADVYRAQMQRLTGGNAPFAPDPTILRQDISELQRKLGLSEVLDERDWHVLA
jgi:hypothetical protein